MNSAGLAILVKTPSLSAVKTRLWPRIGQRCAEAFHLASAEAVASVAHRTQIKTDLTAYWAVAEPEALYGDLWSDLQKLGQGSGPLGARMHHVYQQLRQRHNAALLIGADAPQIALSNLARAAEWLRSDEPRLVIGRTHDGGFWLFGGNVWLPESAWTHTVYSTSTTARDFVQAMGSQGRLLELDMLDDVDKFEDFVPTLSIIDALRDPTEAQRRLARWMSEVVQRECGSP